MYSNNTQLGNSNFILMYAYYFIVVLTRMPQKMMTTVHTLIPFFFDSFVFFIFPFLSRSIITIIIIIRIGIHRPTGLHVLYLRPTYWRTPENPSHRNGTVALTGFLILSSTRSTTRQQIICIISNTRPIALNSYTRTHLIIYMYTVHTHTRSSHVIRIMCSTSL